MSDTDSFIDEVTEEVRRDRMYLLLRRYGWIAAVVVIGVVGGAAFNEVRKSQATTNAQELGDNIIAALAVNDTAERATNLAAIETASPGGQAVVALLTSAAQANSDQLSAAIEGLNKVATNGELPEIYRHIATFKALTLQTDTLSASDRRQQFAALAAPGAPLRLLAEEQMALIDVSEGQAQAAIDRLQAILQDSEASADLQQRASQLIVALGATPEPIPGQQG